MAGAEPISIGELLRRHRIKAGLTQEELAERAGLSARAIRALETGARRAPRKDTLALLTSALGLTTAERDRLEGAMRQRRIPAHPSDRPAGSIRRTHTPLVGRQRERALLDAFLRGEGPSLLLLAGEPGIGKSRLLERAAEQAEELGWTVLAGGCNLRSAQEPYAPCVEALARLVTMRGPAQLRMDLQGCGWLVRLLPELADHTVSPAQSWALPPQQERRLMFAAAARFLENVAGPAGTLLILDDLHWAGVDALDLLAFLLREAPSGNLRIVGAYRDTDVSAHDSLPAVVNDLVRAGLAASVPLAPLAGDEATQLLNLLLTDVPADTSGVRREIVSRAGGIPFYLVSCAQEARAGALAEHADRTDLAEPFTVPWSVAESIRQRVSLLAEPAWEVLTVAAVTERQIPRGVLLPVVEELGYSEGATLSGLEAAIRARLLVEHADGSYSFTHDLIRETVEAELSGARRASLHRRVAEALERLPQPEQRAAELAWHFGRGDELARALPYALRAGDQAEAMYAHDEAERHFAAAGEWARRLGDRAGVGEALEKRADVLFRLARFPEAYTCLEEAIRLYRADGSWERLAWSTAQIARVSDSLGWTESSLIRLEELLKTLAAVAVDGSDTSGESPAGGEDSLERQAASAASLLTPRTAARVYLCLTSRLLFLHRFEEVYEPSERAIQYARASGDLRIESLAYGFRADAQQARGQLAESAASVALAYERAVASDDLEALYIALGAEATIHELHAEPLRARETLLSMLETATQLGDVSYIIETLNSLALVAFALGEWDMSAGYFTRSAALLQGAEADRWCWPAGGPAVLNALRSKQGLPLSVTLVGYFTRSATLLQGTGSDSQHLPAIGLAVLGALRAEQDSSPPVALDGTPVDVEDAVYTRTGVWAIATLAELDILAGRADAASARLRRAIERFEKMPTSAISLFAPLAWAELECNDEVRAREALTQARQLAGEQRNQMALADIERITAIQALRKRRWAEARRALDQSLAICQEGPYSYAEAKARYVYGQLDSAIGRQAAARGQYERALAICERLGERRYRSHIERALTS